MYHASAVLGGVQLVMGGFNTEAKVVLDDFHLFDFGVESWIKVNTVKAVTKEVFVPQCLYENDLKR